MDKIKEFFNKLKTNYGEKEVQLSLIIAIILLVNIVGGMGLNFRMDLTRNNTYSLSDKSKDVVSGLNENLKVRVLFSENLPAQHSSIFKYLNDLLQEYKFYGNKYFSYEIVRGKKELEKQAKSFKLRMVESQELVDDQVKVRRVYMGLVVQYADLIEKIDTISSPEGLEYKLTSLMEKISGKIDGLLKLKEKSIKVKLFLDTPLKSLPIDGIGEFASIVRGAVEKSNAGNYNRLEFQLIDSAAGNTKSTPSEIAELYGINKLRWDPKKGKGGKNKKISEAAFGVVLQQGKRFEIIPLNISPTIFGNYVIAGADKFEDKINNAVGNLLSANKKIGYVTGHGIANLNDNRSEKGAGYLKKILSDIYSIQPLDLTKKKIPEDIGTLIINGPKNRLSDYELFQIDQFILKGKSVIFLVDSFQEIQPGRQQQMFQQQRQPVVLPVDSGLKKLLKHYGVIVNNDIVQDKSCSRVYANGVVKDYFVMPVVKGDGLDDENVITKYLKSVIFLKSSSLELDKTKIKDPNISGKILVTSSDESWLMKGRVNFNPFFMFPPKDGNFNKYGLFASLEGKFSSYFKGREIPEQPVVEKDKKKKKIKQGRLKVITKLDETVKSKRSKIIVLGTSEIASSGFLMNSRKLHAGNKSNSNGNEVFIHSLVDYTSGNYFIPEMMSKSVDNNPLDKTGSTKRVVLKAINTGVVPLVVIIIGIIIWRRSLSRRKKIIAQFSKEA